MEKKLAKLERKTQEAVHTLIRSYSLCHLGMAFLMIANSGQRLAAQKGQSDDIVGAMKAQQERDQANDALSDEED